MNTFLFSFFIILYSKAYRAEIFSAANLSRGDIRAVLNDEGTKPKWSYLLNRSIIYTNKYKSLEGYIRSVQESTGEIKDFNVLSVLQKYNTDVDMITDDNVCTNVLHTLIQHTVDCASWTYTNLFAMLVFKELLLLLDDLTGKTELSPGNDEEDTRNAENGKTDSVKVTDKYSVNFNIEKIEGEATVLRTMSKDNLPDIHSTWRSIIQKGATLDIDYMIQLDSLRSVFKFHDEIKPNAMELVESIFVLTMIIKNTDLMLQDNCVAHDENFVKKYQSLGGELGEEFLKHMEEWDQGDISHSEWNSDLSFFSDVEQGDQCADRRCENCNGCVVSYAMQKINYVDNNIDFVWGAKWDEPTCDYYSSQVPNAVNRKLSIRTSLENDDDNEDSVIEKSNNEGSEGKKPPMLTIILN